VLSVNELAYSIVEEMLDYREEYEEECKVSFQMLDNGAWVIDCGVNVAGSISAGILFSEICMANLADVEVGLEHVNEIPMLFVDVRTDNPVLACLASQKAGWQIKVGDYIAMGSGPARALALKPKETYEALDYEDDAEYAIIALESDRLPDEKVIDYIARECDVESEDVYALVAPTSSIVGSIQISARVVEVAMYRLDKLGFDVKKILSGAGRAPVAPVMEDSVKAMGVTNDCLLYGGSVLLYADFEESEMERLREQKLTSDKSQSYGRPFYDLFKEANYSFYSMDPSLFAPAELVIWNTKGDFAKSGKLNFEVLLKSFGIG